MSVALKPAQVRGAGPGSATVAAGPLPVKLSDLMARLPALAAAAAHLADVLTNRRETPLDRALRENAAVYRGPEPHEALGVTLDFLMRKAGHTAELDLQPLAALGPDGARAAALIQEALGKPAAPGSSKQTAELVNAALESVPYFERAQLKALFEAAAPAAVSAVSNAFTAAPVAKVAPALALAAAPKVPYGDLLSMMTYGTGAITAIAKQALEAVPPGALGQALARGRIDGDGQVGARLLEVLWRCRDGDQLDAAKLLKDFPVEGPQLLAALKGAQAVVQPDRQNYAGMAELVKGLRGNAELIDALVHGPGLVPRSLPSLEAVGALVPDRALAGKGLICAQHLLTNTVCLVEMCLKKGMAPADIHIVGTPYNNNPLVIEYLRSLGVHVVEGRDNLGSTRHLKEQKLQELEEFVGEVSRMPPPANGWKVLDDGGLLQKVISGTEVSAYGRHHPDVAVLQKLFAPQKTEAIEQTTRGSTEVPNPVYSTTAVFRADGKKMEGEYIGWALADSLLMELKQRGKDLKTTRVAIAGAGTIGMWAAEQLRKVGVQVSIIDIKQEVIDAAKAKGIPASLDAAAMLPEVDVVLSASGKNIWPGQLLANWPGLMLSGSSMAAEFDVDQINAFRSTPLDVGNLGRPINFHGDGHAVLLPEEIGITLGLLFAGIVQSPEGAGYHDVDKKLEDAAIAAWKETKGETVRPIATKEKPAQRPDLLANGGAANHDQWLSYLSSLRRPVYPPPNTVRGLVPVYFFNDENGQVRSVDTRTGRSQVVPLPAVPTRGYPLDSSGSRYFYQAGGDAWLWDPGTNAFENQGPFTTEAARFIRDQTSLSGGPQKISVGVALQTAQGLKVLPADAKDFVTIPKTTTGEALTVWPMRGVVMQVQKKPPKISAHVLPGDGGTASMWKNVRLSPRFAEIDAVAQWARQALQVVVGKTAEGETLIVPLKPPSPRDPPEFVLPKGAMFRGIRPSEDGLQGKLIVDYTMPGDPVELSAYRHLTIDLLGPILEGLQRR